MLWFCDSSERQCKWWKSKSYWSSRLSYTHFLEDEGNFYSRDLLLIILQQYGQRDSKQTVFLKTVTTNVKKRKHSLVHVCLDAEHHPGGLHGDVTAQYLVLAPSLRGSSSAPLPVRRRRPLAQSGRGSGSSSCLQERGLQPLSVQTGFFEWWISTGEMGRIFVCTKITGSRLFCWKKDPCVIGLGYRILGQMSNTKDQCWVKGWDRWS